MKLHVFLISILSILTLSITAKSSTPTHLIETDTTKLPYSRQQELFLKEKSLREAKEVEAATLAHINDSLRRNYKSTRFALDKEKEASKELSEALTNKEVVCDQYKASLDECQVEKTEAKEQAEKAQKKVKRRGKLITGLAIVTVLETAVIYVLTAL